MEIFVCALGGELNVSVAFLNALDKAHITSMVEV